MLRIKVDYSKECKKTGKHNIPGEFALYTKDGIFKPWIECATYADYGFACMDAKKLREQHGKIPKYF